MADRPRAPAGAARLPAARQESLVERQVDALVHGVGLTAGLAACLGLAIMAFRAGPIVQASLVVYGVGLLAMLGCSAVYHSHHDGRRASLWRRLDHAAIFVMIAGTYTPFAAVAIGGSFGAGLLLFVWTAAVAGILLKLFDPDRLEALSVAAYLLLGWTILVAIDRLINAVSLPALLLILIGGLLYSTGVLFYRWQALPYHRAIWHGFVLVAAACQYGAVLSVIPEPA